MKKDGDGEIELMWVSLMVCYLESRVVYGSWQHKGGEKELGAGRGYKDPKSQENQIWQML